MNDPQDLKLNNRWIVSQRGEKNELDHLRPYSWLVEKERTAHGDVADTGTVFLTNRECPFKCLMCDLWKNTLDESVPPGAIPQQLSWALSKMTGTEHVKIYNSGSFFDAAAIPRADYGAIADLLSDLRTVIVESHPGLIGDRCMEFNSMLNPELEVAVGLETAHPQVLSRLNKRMTLDDFERAIGFLSRNGIRSRAFILLRPPFLNEKEGILWAKRSLDFAFSCGVECCTVIPVRGGNGAMEHLERRGQFSPPKLSSLEEVVDYGIGLQAGRVFADLWDLELFSSCTACFSSRLARLEQINLTQQRVSGVSCSECGF